jgi:hypothetical protein
VHDVEGEGGGGGGSVCANIVCHSSCKTEEKI